MYVCVLIIAKQYVMLTDHHGEGPIIKLHNIEGVDIYDRDVIDKNTCKSIEHWKQMNGLKNCKTVVTANCRYQVTSRLEDQLQQDANENNGNSARIKIATNNNEQLIENGNENSNNNNNENSNRRGFFESDSEDDNEDLNRNYPCRGQGHTSFLTQTIGTGSRWNKEGMDNGKVKLRYKVIVRHDFQLHRAQFFKNLYVNIVFVYVLICVIVNHVKNEQLIDISK